MRVFDITRKRYKVVSIACIGAMVLQLWTPGVSFAQSAGSGQTETMGGSGTSNMVDLFTGDFSYSIPLMEVDGFPIVLQYDGNVSMNQEASWVGLGWSLNPGAINRDMRGLPDDFDGDEVTRELSTKEDKTTGENNGFETSISFFPDKGDLADYLGLGFGMSWGDMTNSLAGAGTDFKFNVFLTGGTGITDFLGVGGRLNFGYQKNSQTGIGWNKGAAVTAGFVDEEGSDKFGLDATYSSTGYNSTRGTKSKTNSLDISQNMQGSHLGMGYTFGATRAISFGTKTYSPIQRYSLDGQSSFDKVLAGTFFGFGVGSGPAGMNITALYSYENYSSSMQTVFETNSQNAYGYMNLENGNSQSILDFNQENASRVSNTMEVLPVPNVTYDLFSMSGAAGGGQFRAFRNDVGTAADSRTTMKQNGNTSTVNAAIGQLLRFSLRFGTSSVNGSSQKWSGHDADNALNFKNIDNLNPENETFYFKQVGELVPSNSTFLNQYGGERPSRLVIDDLGDQVISNLKLEHFSNNEVSQGQSALPTNNYISGKVNRNTLIAQLDAEESSNCGLESRIICYVPNTDAKVECPTPVGEGGEPRQTSFKQPHHISEFQVTKPSGERCLYNIPVYSLKEKQVTFNVSDRTAHCTTNGLVDYVPGDNSASNSNGRDDFYQSVETPGYAHAFLLRALVSHDYNDRTNDGISADDMGSYVKFNYSCPFPESAPFKWRTPYNDPAASGPQANYQEGNLSYDDDNMGHYMYGEKEMYYVHSIEGKNYVALFHLEERNDLVSVVDENGALGPNTTDKAKRLKKIVLYNKEDIKTNGNNAEPIQTVHFEYDYSLAKGYYGNVDAANMDNTSGKLTLKRIYFTYSKSQKGRLTPYEFEYNGANYNYNPSKQDRWGTYKDAPPCEDPSNAEVSIAVFPYAEQGQANRDAAVSAWSLTDIFLPSGGQIKVEYESDDHGFTEDMRSMEMVEILGMTDNDNINYPSGVTNRFRVGDGAIGKRTPHDIIYLDLPVDIEGSNPTDRRADFRQKYLRDILVNHKNQIYYKVKVETMEGSGEFEFVEGYFKLHEYGVLPGVDDVAWIQVTVVPVSDEVSVAPYPVNPIMHDAWQHLRLNVQRAIFPDANPFQHGIDQNALLNGFNRALANKKFAKTFEIGSSFLRLNSPEKKKLAGGHRVKSLVSVDSWSSMTSESDFDYGQTYQYTHDDGSSTGVAAYEPTVGNDINPMRQPIFYNVVNKKFPDDKFHHTEPFGENFYPAPIIGYEKVRVANLERANVTRNATGYSIHEFFSAREFPTEVYKTDIDRTPIDVDPNVLALLFGAEKVDIFGGSQGFIVKKNDMHGKMKRVSSYNEFDLETSSVEYKYKGFNESCKVLKPDGTTGDVVIGKEVDIFCGSNLTKATTSSFSVGAGIRIPTSFFPFSLFIVPSITQRTDGYVLHSMTKLVHNYAVLDKVETRHLGADVTQQNVAYDEITGDVLVNSTTNEYGDPVFSAAYPVHWHYDGMANAARTYNNHILNPTINTGGTVNVNNPESLFYPGDQLLITPSTMGAPCYRLWVLTRSNLSNSMLLIDENGNPAPADNNVESIRVLRSGHKNQQMMPMASIATLEDPTETIELNPADILNASAVTFSETWKMNCEPQGCGTPTTTCVPQVGDVVNPFLKGLLGNWRMKKSFVYQSDRADQDLASTVDVRTDGAYDSFILFYAYSPITQKWERITSSNHPLYTAVDTEKWLQIQEIEDYDENGSVVTSKDVIGRFRGALYGYNDESRTVPIAVANNARARDMFYDGFEDYNYFDHLYFGLVCRAPGHFDFVESAPTLSESESHTGRYSLQLGPGDAVSASRSMLLCAVPQPHPFITANGFELTCADCLDRFSPAGGTYTIGAWVKESTSAPATQYTAPEMEVTIQTPGGPQVTTVTLGVTEVIEGWQRMEGTVTVPLFAQCFTLILKNNSTSNDVFFDDLRMHPLRATMVSHVYDPFNLRKWSDLNDYNYATVYEYNEQGLLVRVKQETVDGMKTISESRTGLIKQ